MNIYLVIILSLLLAQFLFKLVIEGVNLLNLSETPPPPFQDYPQEKYKNSQRYLKENTVLELAHSAFFTALLFAMILTGAFNTLDLFARSFGFGEIVTGLIFLGIIMLGFELINLPFEIYDTFVVEEKYGFNRTTPGIFILDIFKRMALTAVVGGVAIAGILWFFQKMGSNAWIYCWIAMVIYQFILIYIAPTWIMPLFNKFIPLPPGELREAIEAYARKENFSLEGIYTMDGSKRSTKSNAFFTGFGKNRRVVLFDTLIANHTKDELLSILAHEIGHYKKRHIIKLLIISIINLGLIFFLLSLFINHPKLFEAFGMTHTSIYASFLFFSFLYFPVQLILSVFANTLSRRFEYQADNYAVSTYKKPQAMIDALKKLTIDNLSNLTPHPWKVALCYSHPTVIQRINKIKKAGS